MFLFLHLRLEQYEAMKWLRDEVSINYRCLLLYTLVSLRNSKTSRSVNDSDSVIIFQSSLTSFEIFWVKTSKEPILCSKLNIGRLFIKWVCKCGQNSSS